jgi:hypothetical protein
MSVIREILRQLRSVASEQAYQGCTEHNANQHASSALVKTSQMLKLQIIHDGGAIPLY